MENDRGSGVEILFDACEAVGILVERRGEYVFVHLDRDVLPLAKEFLPETGMKGKTESGHECWCYFCPEGVA